MNAPWPVFGAFLVSMLLACAKSEDNAARKAPAGAVASGNVASPVTSGNVQATASGALTVSARAPAVKAEIGGQVVAVGKNAVELRLFRNGAADALVYDESAAHLADQAKATVLVHAHAAGDTQPSLALSFAAPMGRLSGATSAKVDLLPTPVAVDLKLDGISASGQLEAPVLLVGPEIGGSLVVAGNYGVELLARADGSVEAVVHDAAGALLTGSSNAKVEVKMMGVDGLTHAVALTFDAGKARFVGKVDASIRLAAGPAQISVNGGVGAQLPQLALSAVAAHAGKVIVAGDYSVELLLQGKQLSAFVYDASGMAAVKGDLALAVRLGNGAFMNLSWDAPSASYHGKLNADLDLNVEPITVAVKAGAKAFVGASMPNLQLDGKVNTNLKANADLSAAAKAKLDANARAGLDAKANLKAPTVAAKVAVQAPKISLQAPKLSVGTGANASAKPGASAKAGASFSFGTK